MTWGSATPFRAKEQRGADEHLGGRFGGPEHRRRCRRLPPKESPWHGECWFSRERRGRLDACFHADAVGMAAVLGSGPAAPRACGRDSRHLLELPCAFGG